MQKTYIEKNEDITRKWYIVDAEDKVLGRFASKIAVLLRGKHKPAFSPHQDHGDHVIVINAKKIRLTGKKSEKKRYYRHSGYPGGLKELTFQRMMAKKPEWVIEHAVRGMLPHNRLGRKMFKKLKVYEGPEHPHKAQQPEVLEI